MKRIAGKMIAMATVVMLTIGCLAGCSSQSQSQSSQGSSAETATVTVTDMRGRTVEIPKNVERIIGIGGALRPICYLQAADMVVGVEEAEHEDNASCAYRHINHDLFADLPVVGEGGSKGVTTNEEAIITAAPQLIVSDSLEADEANALQQKTGIPVVCLDQPEEVFNQDYYDNLIFLGEVLGKEDRAEEVVDYIKNVKSDLAQRSASSSTAGTVSAYAAGISFRGGHGFDGTEANFPPFIACDIENVADNKGASGPFTIDLEAVSSAQPQYVFIESGNLSLVADDYKANSAYFDSLDAVQNNNVYTLISYRFYSTNVELALANCYQVGATIYPDQFSDVNPSEKLDEISEFFLGAPIAADLEAKGFSFKQVNIAEL